MNFQDKVNFIWAIAELLRGPYKKEQYGDVVLPMAVLRRFDCVLSPTKEAVLKKYEELKKTGLQNMDPILNKISGQEFNNTSRYDFESCWQILITSPATCATISMAFPIMLGRSSNTSTLTSRSPNSMITTCCILCFQNSIK